MKLTFWLCTSLGLFIMEGVEKLLAKPVKCLTAQINFSKQWNTYRPEQNITHPINKILQYVQAKLTPPPPYFSRIVRWILIYERYYHVQTSYGGVQGYVRPLQPISHAHLPKIISSTHFEEWFFTFLHPHVKLKHSLLCKNVRKNA